MYKQEFKREIKKNTVSNFDQYLKELKIIIKIKININKKFFLFRINLNFQTTNLRLFLQSQMS